MRKTALHIIITALLCLFLLNACKKSFSDQQSVPQQTGQPDLSAKIPVKVAGFITDENGNAVFNATVYAGTKTVTTDEYGYFSISDVMLSKTAAYVKISKAGYFDGFRTFVGKENKETFMRLKLVPKTAIGTINAGSGGTANTADGGIVSLPANAVVVASSNSLYTGGIHVAAHLYKPDNMNEWAATIPGDERGINSDGYLKMIKSYGMLAVELTGDAGELLQIAAGKEATITTPVPAALLASAPSSVPLWSFDETKGLWKQEGSATKNGNTYTGNVQHFSFWNGAIGLDLVNLSTQIVNNTLQPMGNIFVLVRKANDPTFAAAAYSNNQGFVNGAILANTALVLEIYNTCGSPVLVYSQNFTTGTADVDLGTLITNLPQQVLLSGTAVNCSNAPITNGYVILSVEYAPNSTTRYQIPINNGNFDFAIVACANMFSNYVAIDEDAHQQGTTQTITLVPGTNNLGNLIACGTSTLSFIDYAVDGGSTIHLSEPLDTMFSSYSYNGGLNSGGSVATIGSIQNLQPDLQFTWFGLNTLGNTHTVNDLWSISFAGVSHRARIPVPLELTFTEFGEIGGFIAGSFSGNVENWDDSSAHTITCSFRVRRWH